MSNHEAGDPSKQIDVDELFIKAARVDKAAFKDLGEEMRAQLTEILDEYNDASESLAGIFLEINARTEEEPERGDRAMEAVVELLASVDIAIGLGHSESALNERAIRKTEAMALLAEAVRLFDEGPVDEKVLSSQKINDNPMVAKFAKWLNKRVEDSK